MVDEASGTKQNGREHLLLYLQLTSMGTMLTSAAKGYMAPARANLTPTISSHSGKNDRKKNTSETTAAAVAHEHGHTEDEVFCQPMSPFLPNEAPICVIGHNTSYQAVGEADQRRAEVLARRYFANLLDVPTVSCTAKALPTSAVDSAVPCYLGRVGLDALPINKSGNGSHEKRTDAEDLSRSHHLSTSKRRLNFVCKADTLMVVMETPQKPLLPRLVQGMCNIARHRTFFFVGNCITMGALTSVYMMKTIFAKIFRFCIGVGAGSGASNSLPQERNRN